MQSADRARRTGAARFRAHGAARWGTRGRPAPVRERVGESKPRRDEARFRPCGRAKAPIRDSLSGKKRSVAAPFSAEGRLFEPAAHRERKGK